MRFQTTIELGGKTATGFEVPEDVVTELGSGKRPPVNVTIGDHTYRSTVAPMGGVFMVPLSAENREKAGVAAGDEIDVELTLYTEPRGITVPDDFAAALAADDTARTFFEGLSYSQKRWFVHNVESAKKAETRERRVVAMVERLRERRGAR